MAAIPTPMTVEEFLRLLEVEGERIELIHGELVQVPYGRAPRRIGPGTEWIPDAPEIAIEVVSSETAARLEDKIELYLAHGSKSVWVAYPKKRVVRIYDTRGGAREFERDQPLADPVLPGFSIPTSANFEGV